MARKLTNRQLDLYEQLRKKVMSVRRKAIRRRKEIEQSQGGRLHDLPALVIPKRPPTRNAITGRADSWSAYKKYIAQMKTSLSATREVRFNFFVAFRDILSREGVEFERGRVRYINGIEVAYKYDKGEGKYKLLPEEEKAPLVDEDLLRFAEVYQELYALAYGHNGLTKFLDMYERGYIVQLRWLYDELKGLTTAGRFTGEQEELYELYKQTARAGKGTNVVGSSGYELDKLGKGWGRAKTGRYKVSNHTNLKPEHQGIKRRFR